MSPLEIKVLLRRTPGFLKVGLLVSSIVAASDAVGVFSPLERHCRRLLPFYEPPAYPLAIVDLPRPAPGSPSDGTQGGSWTDRQSLATSLRAVAACSPARIYLDVNLHEEHGGALDEALESALAALPQASVALPILPDDQQGKGFSTDDPQSASGQATNRFLRHATPVDATLRVSRRTGRTVVGGSPSGGAESPVNVARWLIQGPAATPGMTEIDFHVECQPIPHLEVAELLTVPDKRRQITGKAVILGWNEARVAGPYSPSASALAGRTELLALAAQTVADRSLTSSVAWWKSAIMQFVLATSFALVAIKCSKRWIAMLCIGTLGAWGILAVVGYGHGLRIPLLAPMMALALGAIGGGVQANPTWQRWRRALMDLYHHVDPRLIRLFDAHADAIIACTEEGRVVAVNRAANELFSGGDTDLAGRDLSLLLPNAAAEVLLGLQRRQVGRLADVVVDAAGEHRHVDVVFSMVPHGNSWFGYLVIRDVSEFVEREQHLKKLAAYDPLTGVLNRQYLEQRYRATLSEASRRQQTFAVFLIDLDHLKQINDHFGHQAGDQALRWIAQSLQSCMRKSDTVARFGGDEFVIVTSPGVGKQEATFIQRRIQQQIDSLDERYRFPIVLRASVGFAVYPDDGRDFTSLLHWADKQMYGEKARNRFVGIPLSETPHATTTNDPQGVPGRTLPGNLTGEMDAASTG